MRATAPAAELHSWIERTGSCTPTGLKWRKAAAKHHAEAKQVGKQSYKTNCESSQSYLCIIPLQLSLLHTVAPTETGTDRLVKVPVNCTSEDIIKQCIHFIFVTDIFCMSMKTAHVTIGPFLHLKRVFPTDNFLAAETEEVHITAEECSEWKT